MCRRIGLIGNDISFFLDLGPDRESYESVMSFSAVGNYVNPSFVKSVLKGDFRRVTLLSLYLIYHVTVGGFLQKTT